MADEEIRVGVFLCDCGNNIAGLLDVPSLVDYSSQLEDVVFSEEGKWICSVDYLKNIKDAISQHDLNRVVVACCTPRTHEPTFRSTLKEAGINPLLLEFVSIREHVSWVHKDDPEGALRKAKDLIRMGVVKARLLMPGKEIRLPVGRECLIIGGGIAGMTAASGLAEQGFDVVLVEKEACLGGNLRTLNTIAPFDTDAYRTVLDREERIGSNDRIRILLEAKVEEVKGHVGNFQVRVKVKGSDETFKVSTIIVATGMKEVEPVGLLGYGKYPNIITQLEFERRMKQGRAKELGNVAFVTCVGSRNDEKGCCSIGCLSSVKNAKALRMANGDSKVYLIHRNLNITGNEIAYQEEAIRDHDIALIRYPDQELPGIHGEDGKLSITLKDVNLGRRLRLLVDTIVLAVGYKGDPLTKDLKGLLRVSVDKDGFYQEAHVKLRPLDFASDGIFLAGSARHPKGVKDTIMDAMGAAMRASIPMRRGYVESDGIVSVIDLEMCTRCTICARTCPYGAIEMVEANDGGKEIPSVIEALCKGCGTCAAECPRDCIDIVHFTDRQIVAQIEAALSEDPEEKVLAFACHWCAMGALDTAGVGRMQYPSNIRVIRLMCSGRVDRDFIRRAFELGAGGVLIAGCDIPTCHYISGNRKCQKRLERVRRGLEREGYDTSRLHTIWLSAADGPKWVAKVKDMVDGLGL